MGSDSWFYFSLAITWPVLSLLGYWLYTRWNRSTSSNEKKKTEDRERFAAFIESLPDRRRPLPELDTTPDTPRDFHLRAAWLAVPNSTPEAFAESLGLLDLEPANWESGLARADLGWVYLTPAISGWTFAVSSPPSNYHLAQSDPGIAAQELLKALSRQFGSAFYFVNDDDCRLHGWARADAGVITRAYGFISMYGPRMAFECGTPTPIEIAIGIETQFTRADEHNGPLREGMRYPTTTDVIAVARDWSLDPSGPERGGSEASVGILGSLDAKYHWWE